MPKETLIRIKAVMVRTGIGRTSIYKRIKEGTFPAPVKIGNSSAWAESEIDKWVDNVILKKKVA